MLPDPSPRDGDGDDHYTEFNRNLSGLKFKYRDTFTIAELTAALETAYAYGALAPKAYARRILERLHGR